MDVIASTFSTFLSTTTMFVMDLDTFQSQYVWAVILGFILAFTLGAAMGSNDVANAFGTSVGSKVLTIRMAYILATIMETLGAVLLGFNVSDTMRKNVIDVGLYADDPRALMLGQIAILGAGTLWLTIATVFGLPISTTHSIVGATVGFSVMFKGTRGINWKKVAEIAVSWVLSPVLAGVISLLMYLLLDFTVLRQSNPLKAGFVLLPIFFFFVFFMNSITVFLSGSKVLGLAGLPLYATLLGSLAVGLVAGILAQFVLKPWLRNWVENKEKKKSVFMIEKGPSKIITNLKCDKQEFHFSMKGFWRWLIPHPHRIDDPRTLLMFSSLQIFTACFAGFAHGANDVSNAIAPLTALVSIYNDLNVQQTTPTPIYILLFGTASVCIGLWVLGHRVIKTIGDDVTEVNPANGFIIEFGAAVTVMMASKVGLPISTTHCLIGAVIGVGIIKPGDGVNWKMFGNIFSSWVITLPATALISAGITFLLKLTL